MGQSQRKTPVGISERERIIRVFGSIFEKERTVDWSRLFHKLLENSSVAERLPTSQEGLSPMELVSWLVCYLWNFLRFI
jgi:hypothetical protein